MTDAVLASRELEGKAPVDVLRWASRELGDTLTFATGFGAEGCVIIDLIARADLSIDIFTLDTGVLFPETYTLWRQLEAKYGMTIRAVTGPTLEEQAAAHGAALWERDPDLCCDLRKVRPLRSVLAGRAGWITAIRRDQTAERASAQIVERDEKFGR
jgi:phosphoadenylyl-sulfate reductase (thioredoxin)